jgi:hypothetical protein
VAAIAGFALELRRMLEWFDSLNGTAKFFWTIAIGASVFQVLLFIGSLFGMDGHDVDHPDGGGMEGAKFLSVRAIVAFLVGFGWTGALLLGDGVSLFHATLAALLGGAVFMLVVYGILRTLVGMSADGTLNYQNAIGESGHVYVTIPPDRSGSGQIEILFQGRLVTANAVTDELEALPPHTQVIVKAVQGHTTLVVSPSH